MANAYNGLSEEERERVFLLAVGKHDFRRKDQNFCQGFAACADDSDGSWWTTWDVAQRDVFFYIKMDPNDDDSWQYHCRYSMNTGRDEFENTIREMLTMTEAISETLNEADDELAEGYLAGNETSIGQGQSSQNDIPAVKPINSNASSSSLSLNALPFFMLSAAVLSWSNA
jgi:hypothetical protein